MLLKTRKVAKLGFRYQHSQAEMVSQGTTRTNGLTKLSGALIALLEDAIPGCGPVSIIERESNEFFSTAVSELVRCKLNGRKELRLFCKGSGPPSENWVKSGVDYEASVYHKVLVPCGASTPHFYGVVANESREQVLVLEHVDGIRLNKSSVPNVLQIAAKWIGNFHRVNENRVSAKELDFLRTYDDGFYRTWSQNNVVVPDAVIRFRPWIEVLWNQSEVFHSVLKETPLTIIHGEFYPENVLVETTRISPVDWECAGLGPGVFDLVALTQGWWREETIRQCEIAYCKTRWPSGAPAQFERTLAAARVHCAFRLLFHWLHVDPTRLDDEQWLFEQMESSGTSLGLL